MKGETRSPVLVDDQWSSALQQSTVHSSHEASPCNGGREVPVPLPAAQESAPASKPEDVSVTVSPFDRPSSSRKRQRASSSIPDNSGGLEATLAVGAGPSVPAGALASVGGSASDQETRNKRRKDQACTQPLSASREEDLVEAWDLSHCRIQYPQRGADSHTNEARMGMVQQAAGSPAVGVCADAAGIGSSCGASGVSAVAALHLEVEPAVGCGNCLKHTESQGPSSQAPDHLSLETKDRLGIDRVAAHSALGGCVASMGMVPSEGSSRIMPENCCKPHQLVSDVGNDLLAAGVEDTSSVADCTDGASYRGKGEEDVKTVANPGSDATGLACDQVGVVVNNGPSGGGRHENPGFCGHPVSLRAAREDNPREQVFDGHDAEDGLAVPMEASAATYAQGSTDDLTTANAGVGLPLVQNCSVQDGSQEVEEAQDLPDAQGSGDLHDALDSLHVQDEQGAHDALDSLIVQDAQDVHNAQGAQDAAGVLVQNCCEAPRIVSTNLSDGVQGRLSEALDAQNAQSAQEGVDVVIPNGSPLQGSEASSSRGDRGNPFRGGIDAVPPPSTEAATDDAGLGTTASRGSEGADESISRMQEDERIARELQRAYDEEAEHAVQEASARDEELARRLQAREEAFSHPWRRHPRPPGPTAGVANTSSGNRTAEGGPRGGSLRPRIDSLMGNVRSGFLGSSSFAAMFDDLNDETMEFHDGAVRGHGFASGMRSRDLAQPLPSGPDSRPAQREESDGQQRSTAGVVLGDDVSVDAIRIRDEMRGAGGISDEVHRRQRPRSSQRAADNEVEGEMHEANAPERVIVAERWREHRRRLRGHQVFDAIRRAEERRRIRFAREVEGRGQEGVSDGREARLGADSGLASGEDSGLPAGRAQPRGSGGFFWDDGLESSLLGGVADFERALGRLRRSRPSAAEPRHQSMLDGRSRSLSRPEAQLWGELEEDEDDDWERSVLEMGADWGRAERRRTAEADRPGDSLGALRSRRAGPRGAGSGLAAGAAAARTPSPQAREVLHVPAAPELSERGEDSNADGEDPQEDDTAEFHEHNGMEEDAVEEEEEEEEEEEVEEEEEEEEEEGEDEEEEEEENENTGEPMVECVESGSPYGGSAREESSSKREQWDVEGAGLCLPVVPQARGSSRGNEAEVAQEGAQEGRGLSILGGDAGVGGDEGAPGGEPREPHLNARLPPSSETWPVLADPRQVEQMWGQAFAVWTDPEQQQQQQQRVGQDPQHQGRGMGPLASSPAAGALQASKGSLADESLQHTGSPGDSLQRRRRVVERTTRHGLARLPHTAGQSGVRAQNGGRGQSVARAAEGAGEIEGGLLDAPEAPATLEGLGSPAELSPGSDSGPQSATVMQLLQVLHGEQAAAATGRARPGLGRLASAAAAESAAAPASGRSVDAAGELVDPANAAGVSADTAGGPADAVGGSADAAGIPVGASGGSTEAGGSAGAARGGADAVGRAAAAAGGLSRGEGASMTTLTSNRGPSTTNGGLQGAAGGRAEAEGTEVEGMDVGAEAGEAGAREQGGAGAVSRGAALVDLGMYDQPQRPHRSSSQIIADLESVMDAAMAALQAASGSVSHALPEGAEQHQGQGFDPERELERPLLPREGRQELREGQGTGTSSERELVGSLLPMEDTQELGEGQEPAEGHEAAEGHESAEGHEDTEGQEMRQEQERREQEQQTRTADRTAELVEALDSQQRQLRALLREQLALTRSTLGATLLSAASPGPSAPTAAAGGELDAGLGSGASSGPTRGEEVAEGGAERGRFASSLLRLGEQRARFQALRARLRATVEEESSRLPEQLRRLSRRAQLLGVDTHGTRGGERSNAAATSPGGTEGRSAVAGSAPGDTQAGVAPEQGGRGGALPSPIPMQRNLEQLRSRLRSLLVDTGGTGQGRGQGQGQMEEAGQGQGAVKGVGAGSPGSHAGLRQ